mmetsp:Transcript_18007/g.45766  ORF Transcript_18007/g.45766 Transcript_18007/m.45766 type:complete len:413 (-) Transcript_18007:130-1368(-)
MAAVLVIGAGYGGVFAVRRLEKAGLDVVLVERCESFFHKIGGAKACIQPGYENLAVLPLDKLLHRPGSRLVWGEVVALDAKSKSAQVRLAAQARGSTVGRKSDRDGAMERISFDFVVLAVGLAHGFGQLPDRMMTREEMLAYCREKQAHVRAAGSVAIVGGGALGVEASAQIRADFRDKNVSLFHSRGRLMSAAEPPVSAHFSDKLLRKLQNKFGVDVKLNARRPLEALPEQLVAPAEDHVAPTLTINAVGCKLQDSSRRFIPTEWLHPETGEVVVNSALQVEGAPAHVFAIGDVARTGDYKQARWASRHAQIVTKNILVMVAERESAGLTLYSPVNHNSVAVHWLYRVLGCIYVEKRVPESCAVVTLYLGNDDGIGEFFGLHFNERFARKYLLADKGSASAQAWLNCTRSI